MTNTKLTFSRIFKILFVVIPSLLNLLSHIGLLFKIEARIAGRSIIKLIVLSFFMVTLLFSTWLCVLALLYIYLISIHLSALLSLTVLLAINILLLAIIAFSMMRAKRGLNFEETSQQIAMLTHLND